jgi:IS30 family transposase
VGDWEGNTIESASIATFVDRKTKVLLAKLMPDKRADTLNKAAVRAFRGIPPEARHTLTLDNGKEFAAHGALSQALSFDIFLPIPIIPGSGTSTSIPTGSSGSTFLKKYRLTP